MKHAKYSFEHGFGPNQPKACTFPSTKGRRFQRNWYRNFNWLEYSPQLDHAFCFPCRVFSHSSCGAAFVHSGFQNWKDTMDKFHSHEKSRVHLTSHQRWLVAQQVRQNPEQSVQAQLDHQRSSTIRDNRQYLQHVIETLLFFGRQCLSSRGHRENDESLNKGNFLELMDLCSKDNSMIKRFYQHKEMYVTYTSHNIQDTLLEIMASNIRNQILLEVKSSILCLYHG